MFNNKKLNKLEKTQEMIWERFKELQRDYISDYNRLNKKLLNICEEGENLWQSIATLTEKINEIETKGKKKCK